MLNFFLDCGVKRMLAKERCEVFLDLINLKKAELK